MPWVAVVCRWPHKDGVEGLVHVEWVIGWAGSQDWSVVAKWRHDGVCNEVGWVGMG